MSINAIHFQSGLSMPEFIGKYGSEAKCYRALYKARSIPAWMFDWISTHSAERGAGTAASTWPPLVDMVIAGGFECNGLLEQQASFDWRS